MSKPQLLSIGESIAYGAKMSSVDSVYFHAAQALSEAENAMKKLGVPANLMVSLSSAVNAATGSELGGKRSLVVSSVNNCSYCNVSYMRIPLVIANMWPPNKAGHDCMSSFKDAGFITFIPESTQEVVDTIIQACKVSESKNILMPSVVNIDMAGFQEPAHMPEERFARNYVSKFLMPHQISERKQQYFNSDYDPSFTMQQHKVMKNVPAVVESTSVLWKKKTSRSLPLVETYKLEDAEYAIIVSGFSSTTAKAAVNQMRTEGKKVGLLRIRVSNPWPADAVKIALKNIKKSLVFERFVSISSCGVLYNEAKHDSGFCSSFLLLGRYPNEKDFIDMFNRLVKSEKEEVV